MSSALRTFPGAGRLLYHLKLQSGQMHRDAALTASSDSYHDCPQSPLSQKLPSPWFSPSKHLSHYLRDIHTTAGPRVCVGHQKVSEAHKAMGLIILSLQPDEET